MADVPENDDDYYAWLNELAAPMAERLEDDEDAQLNEAFRAASAAAEATFMRVFAEYGFTVERAVRN
jgi:hypothetical protein